MTSAASSPITIGMLPGWPVFGSIVLDRFLQYVVTGVRVASLDHGCNLLVACGVSRTPGMRSLHTAWPAAAPDCDFVPIGPWNTSGLIVAAPLRSDERTRYIRKVMDDNFPVVFIGAGDGSPAILIDNEGGIRQAVEHLVKHGHRRIAFLAGDPLDQGDSAMRLRAYRSAVEEFEAESDPRLVAYGYHYREGGHKAMEQILATGSAFTAVIASNDVSAYGAMEMLRATGRRIPTDVAVIGFDDQPASAGQVPPLTSVHYPLFEVGIRAVDILLQRIRNPEQRPPEEIQVPSWLSVRQSCGCLPHYAAPSSSASGTAATMEESGIRRAMCESMLANIGNLSREQTQDFCLRLLQSYRTCVAAGTAAEFQRTLQEILEAAEAAEDHVEGWQAVISVLRSLAVPHLPEARRAAAENLLHQARMIISEAAERQCMRLQVTASELNHHVGWMAARMFNARTEKEIVGILSDQLDSLGIRSAQVAFFEPRRNDPFGGLRLYFDLKPAADGDSGENLLTMCCDTRDFPPPATVGQSGPYSMALLPLVFQGEPMGFISFDAANMEPLATIVRQMSAALKNAHMQAQINELSLSDDLTGVQNRRYFDLFLQREVDRARRYGRGLAVLLLDLDGFKQFNDAYGPGRGNEALKAVTDCILAEVHRGSDLVARYGGDEFSVILPETTLTGAGGIAEAIQSRLQKISGLYGSLSVSIGIAVAGSDSVTTEDLVENAERALYRAKSGGRNRIAVISTPPPPAA
jgi:diguanylate cyclase (GGDEF)-like protein